MKFRATVKVATVNNLEHLTRAFYTEGGPNSKIEINDKTVTMEIDFVQVPKELIKAITYSKVMNFHYIGDELESKTTKEGIIKVQISKESQKEISKQGFIDKFFKNFDPNSSIEIKGDRVRIEKNIELSREIIQVLGLQKLLHFSDMQKVVEKESSDQPKQDETGEEGSEQSEQDETGEEGSKQPEQESAVEDNSEKPKSLSTIPELDEIAKESTSYQEFVSSVIEKFELGGRSNIFANLISAAENVKTIKWVILQAELMRRQIILNNSDRNWITYKIEEKFKNSEGNVTILELIEGIVKYKKFKFGCKKEEKSAPEVEVQEETSDEPEQGAAEKESSDQPKQDETGEESSDQPEQKSAVEDDSEKCKFFSTIPELDEIAEESTSYQEFVSSVIEKFELGGRQNIFANLIRAAEQVQTVSWVTLQKNLKDNEIDFQNADKKWITMQIRNQFRNSEGKVAPLKLIKAIVEYKTFDFNGKEDEEESSEQPEQEETEEKTIEIEVVTPNAGKVKMACMPEIPKFEEILGSVDKTQTVEEISKHILKGMGLVEKNSREQQYLIDIVSVALETDFNDWESICDRAGIQKKNRVFAQLTLSKFINDYVKMFYPDNAVIKAIVFLKELREILMS